VRPFFGNAIITNEHFCELTDGTFLRSVPNHEVGQSDREQKYKEKGRGNAALFQFALLGQRLWRRAAQVCFSGLTWLRGHDKRAKMP
jgi:hypothetical protein